MTSNNLPDEFPKKDKDKTEKDILHLSYPRPHNNDDGMQYYTVQEICDYPKSERIKIAKGIWGIK